MDWTAPIDIYCERVGTEYWAEPLNAISNGAFILASIYVLAIWRAESPRDRPALFFAVMIGIIGVGSFLFHTFANQWSVIADVAPIMVMIYGFFALVLNRYVGLGAIGTILSLVVFFALTYGINTLLTPSLGGSAGYVPALLALVAIGLYLTILGDTFGRTLLTAAAIFFLSLTIRTLDMPVCNALPIGIHYFWHILNAITLAVLVVGVIRTPPQRDGRAGSLT